MEAIFNSNPYALPRVLHGKTKYKIAALVDNKRVGKNGIPDDVFNSIILPGISPVIIRILYIIYYIYYILSFRLPISG